MADTNTTAADQGSAVEANGATADTTPAKLHATRADAEANKPADATKNHKVFEVSKAGATVGFIWARGYDNALALTARSEGFTASLGTTATVTKEAAKAKVLEMSDDEFKALVAARKAAAKK